MSFFGSVEAIVAEALVPSMKETRMFVAPSTTCKAVMIEPLALMITPAPRPDASPLVGGALGLDLDERGQDLLVGDGRRCGRRLEVLDRLLGDVGRDRADLRLVERWRRRVAGGGVDPAGDEHDERRSIL